MNEYTKGYEVWNRNDYPTFAFKTESLADIRKECRRLRDKGCGASVLFRVWLEAPCVLLPYGTPFRGSFPRAKGSSTPEQDEARKKELSWKIFYKACRHARR